MGGEPRCELQPWKHHQNKCFASAGDSGCPQCHITLQRLYAGRATEVPHGWKCGLWSSAEQGHLACLRKGMRPRSSHLIPPQKKAGGLALPSLTPTSPYPCPCGPSLPLSTCQTSPRASAPAESRLLLSLPIRSDQLSQKPLTYICKGNINGNKTPH